MPDRLSLMLDSMISAVDNGLSFDGIVSMPELGLEDFGHRPGLAGYVDDATEQIRRARESVSKFFRGTPPPPDSGYPEVHGPSRPDSGIGAGAGPVVPATPVQPPPKERLPKLKPGLEEKEETRLQETLPTQTPKQGAAQLDVLVTHVPPTTADDEHAEPSPKKTLPRKQRLEEEGETHPQETLPTPTPEQGAAEDTHAHKTQQPSMKPQPQGTLQTPPPRQGAAESDVPATYVPSTTADDERMEPPPEERQPRKPSLEGKGETHPQKTLPTPTPKEGAEKEATHTHEIQPRRPRQEPEDDQNLPSVQVSQVPNPDQSSTAPTGDEDNASHSSGEPRRRI